MQDVFYKSNGALFKIYQYLLPMETVRLRLLCREINMVVRQSMSTIQTKENA